MNGFKKQEEFSSLYHEASSNSKKFIQCDFYYPFKCITPYVLEEIEFPNSNNFQENLNYLTNLKKDLVHAFDCFEVELHLIEYNKVDYLNKNLDFIFEQYKQISEQNEFLASELIKTMGLFCNPPHLKLISNKNRRRLLRWYNIKEPIKSFILKKPPEAKWFEEKYNGYGYGFHGKLISSDTEFSTFKALFDGKYIENKINWIGKKSSLVYFIKELIKSGVIESPQNKHWQIVSEFMLLDGEPIKQSELKNQQNTTNKRKRNRINAFIRLLVNY